MAEEADTPSADGSSNILMLTKHVSIKFYVQSDLLPLLIQLMQRSSKGCSSFPLTVVIFSELGKVLLGQQDLRNYLLVQGSSLKKCFEHHYCEKGCSHACVELSVCSR